MSTARPLHAPAPAAGRSATLAASLLALLALGPAGCGPKEPPVAPTGGGSSLFGRPNRYVPQGTCSCVCSEPRRDSFPSTATSTTTQADIEACHRSCDGYEGEHTGTSCRRLFYVPEGATPSEQEVARELERLNRPRVAADTDADGTPDKDDRCPNTTGPRENGGCPDTDSDSDGIVDRNDRCVDRVGPPENAGCPDTDSDGDGIVDRHDHCKDKPEAPNGYQDDDGCPDELPTRLAQFTGRIEGIVFKSGSHEIDKRSDGVLDKAAEVLREFANARFEIEGHTDDRGDAKKNTDLSQRRAESVKNWLVGKGVSGSRLVPVGYGPSRPIADNKTNEGRQKNRRVEFKLMSTTHR